MEEQLKDEIVSVKQSDINTFYEIMDNALSINESLSEKLDKALLEIEELKNTEPIEIDFAKYENITKTDDLEDVIDEHIENDNIMNLDTKTFNNSMPQE